MGLVGEDQATIGSMSQPELTGSKTQQTFPFDSPPLVMNLFFIGGLQVFENRSVNETKAKFAQCNSVHVQQTSCVS